MFSSNPVELHKQLNGNGIHQLENIITLDYTLHKAFDTLSLWFKPVDVCLILLLSRSYAERARGLIPAVLDGLRTVPGLRTRLHRACRPWALFHLVVYHIYH